MKGEARKEKWNRDGMDGGIENKGWMEEENMI